jgi:VWFA-related protein
VAPNAIGPRCLTVLFALAILSAGLLALRGEGLARPAQQAASATSASSPDQAIHVGVPLVNLYATVLDNHKAVVKDLDQSDFKVFEDKVEQKISFFSHEKTLPLSIGLLIDTSVSEQNKIEEEQKAASQFFHRVLQEGDKAFVIEFDVGATLLSSWTSDVDVLDRAIHRAATGGGGAGQLKPGVFYPNLGGTRLYDTIYAASLKKMPSESGRKALIILTDATDQGSVMTIKQAVEAAQRADTLIQVLVVYEEKRYASFDAAKRLAEETGGRAIDIGSQNRLQKAFDQISDELRSEYSLGYYPTNTTPDGKYRQIKLEMTFKNYKVLARKGYYSRAETK